jgi:hypothetical protein
MNEIARFLRQNRRCTKFTCTTCGGLLAFHQDLNDWIEQTQPDLFNLVNSLTIGELDDIKNWPIFVNIIIHRIPDAEKQQLTSSPIFHEFIKRKQQIKQREEARYSVAERRRAEKAKCRKERELLLKEKISRLSLLPPVDRFNAILEDLSFTLDEFPDEWAILPDEYFNQYDSIELTGILKKMDNQVTQRKGVWKDLRSYLYQLRQRIYNKEKGYSKGDID